LIEIFKFFNNYLPAFGKIINYFKNWNKERKLNNYNDKIDKDIKNKDTQKLDQTINELLDEADKVIK